MHDSSSGKVRPGTIVAALVVVAVATCIIFWRLASEPHFADESANIAQSYYYGLFKNGRWDHPNWLHYAAFDHPPLPKYLVGLSLDLAGLPVPQSLDRWMEWMGYVHMGGEWRASPAGGDFSPPGNLRVLYWARVPAAIFGVIGVLAVYLIGLHVRGRVVGMVAALLLTINPLYLTESRRAVPDPFSEGLVTAAVAVSFWGCQELWSVRFHWWRWIVLTASESLLCGLATLSKLNGGIAAPIVVSVLVLGTWLAGRRSRTTESNRRLDGRNLMAGPVVALAIGAGSFLVFLGLNPFLTARPALPSEASSELRELAASGPIGRTRFLLDFRRGWARDARQNAAFQKDWLPTMTDRLRMTVWEGFGRFSTLGPREIRTITIKDFDTNERDGRLRPNELPEWIRGRFNRIDTDRDGTVDKDELAEFLDGAPPLYLYGRSASLIWLPLVLLGVAWSARAGWSRYRAGGPPHPWVMLLYTVAVVAVVVLLIPLNWDRYYLPMQPCAALLVPCGIAATLRWVGGRLVLQPAPVRVD